MTHATLEQALKTKLAVVISSRIYEHNGEVRSSLKVRKANGKKVFMVVQYASGRYSEGV
jgi:hypothetical protein